jgi:hypothetical protein
MMVDKMAGMEMGMMVEVRMLVEVVDLFISKEAIKWQTWAIEHDD